MSEFLMVFGPEWTRIEDVTTIVVTRGEAGVFEAIQGTPPNPGEIESMIEDAGLLPPNVHVAEAFIMNTSDPGEARIRLWVRYVPAVP